MNKIHHHLVPYDEEGSPTTNEHLVSSPPMRIMGSVQGLGELGKHKSRLEKEKEAAAAARKAAGGSPAPGKLPSYMRPTSASKAMQKVLA